jgi:hypothetical protein
MNDQHSLYAALEEISAAACDDNPDRLALPQLYNKVNLLLFHLEFSL